MRGFAPLLAFDIETVPDIPALRAEHGIPDGVGDTEAHEFVCRLRRQRGQGEFLPHSLHKVAVISCALLEDRDNGFRLFSLETRKEGEAKVVERFFKGIERLTPRLLSWNGKGFDMPVLHYRGLLHGVVAPAYWDTGETDQGTKWNNYTSRYHARHTDLMDVLASHQPRAWASLGSLARQMGLPVKMGMDGSKVWGAWQRGEHDAIRFYCETDAVNTLLLGLRFERMRGTLSGAVEAKKREVVLAALSRLADPGWGSYLSGLSPAMREGAGGQPAPPGAGPAAEAPPA